MRSLTSRLVATTVALVLVVCVLIATVTALAMRQNLMGRLDAQVQEALRRDVAMIAGPQTTGYPGDQTAGPMPHFGPGPGLGSSVGSVTAVLADAGQKAALRVTVDSDGRPQRTALGPTATAQVADLTADGRPHSLELSGLGRYRAAAQQVDGGVVVTALPSSQVDTTMRDLVLWEVALALLGVVAAAGAGVYLVRRQLAPLREVVATAHTVARLPLATGEVEVAERVPARLTDERSEVGQVGSALNTLLAHMEESLSARHRSEQQVRQFVADASHELRTPLTTIRGYTELAQQRPDAVAVALGKVGEESGRMTSLVEDLLLLARLDQGRPLAKGPVDLTRLLLEAVDDARVVSTDHDWRLEVPDEAEATVLEEADEQRLHQVITNLLTNARRHTPAGTTITVRVRPDGFDVHDDGPGFAPELVPHAFERFTRGDSARNREGGAGLGLSLVHAIVTSHGGTVSLTSEPGDTTIAVRLPAGTSPAAEPARHDAPTRDPESSGPAHTTGEQATNR